MNDPIQESLQTLSSYLEGAGGINDVVREVHSTAGGVRQSVPEVTVEVTDLPIDIDERITSGRFPRIQLRCVRSSTTEHRKLGSNAMDIELQATLAVTDHNPDQLAIRAARYTHALLVVIQRATGKWSDRLLYDGKFQADFRAIEVGGSAFIKQSVIRLGIHAMLQEING